MHSTSTFRPCSCRVCSLPPYNHYQSARHPPSIRGKQALGSRFSLDGQNLGPTIGDPHGVFVLTD